MVAGKLVLSAALGLKKTLAATGLLSEDGYTTEQFVTAARAYVERYGALRSESRYEAPPGAHWDDAHYRGEAYAAYAWAVYIAEVTVDLSTWSVAVDDFVAVQEVGRVLIRCWRRGRSKAGWRRGLDGPCTRR